MNSVSGPDEDLAEVDLTEGEIDTMMAAGMDVEMVPPPLRAGQPFVALYVDESDRFGWQLCSATGEVLANGRLYGTKAAAVAAARTAMQAGAHATLLDRTAS